MARYAGQLFKRAASLAKPGYRPIRLRVGALAMSSNCARPRNITVAGTGDASPYPAWAANTLYSEFDVRIYGGQQWSCHAPHTSGTTFSGPTHWYELRPLSYFSWLWINVYSSNTTAQDAYDRLRAANPGCKLFQYVNIDTAYTAQSQQGINLYTWLDANKGWLYSSEPGTNSGPDTRVPVDTGLIGNAGQCIVNFDRTTIVDSNGDNYHNWLAKQRASSGYYATMKFDGWACDNSLSLLEWDATPAGSPNWDDNVDDYVGNGSEWNSIQNFWGTGYHRAGASETCQNANVKPLIHAGFAEFWRALRKHNPGTRVCANGGIKQPSAWAGGAYDCMLFEGWGASYSSEHLYTNGWLQGQLANYRVATQFASWRTLPAVWNWSMFDHPSGSATLKIQSALPGGMHQDVLYGLCSALLSDSWFAWNQTGISATQPRLPAETRFRLYIAEYDTPAGVPVEPPPKVATQNGVWSRAYENALVLVHPRLTRFGWESEPPRTFTLPFACRRLTGTLDPADDGSLLPAGSTVSLPVRTGLILLRA